MTPHEWSAHVDEVRNTPFPERRAVAQRAMKDMADWLNSRSSRQDGTVTGRIHGSVAAAVAEGGEASHELWSATVEGSVYVGKDLGGAADIVATCEGRTLDELVDNMGRIVSDWAINELD